MIFDDKRLIFDGKVTLTQDSEVDGGGDGRADAVVGHALVDSHFLATDRIEVQNGSLKCFRSVGK